MNKIPVAILGATGTVGQRFVQLLSNHPWFEIAILAASDRSAGKPYREVVSWKLDTPLPEAPARMVVQNCEPTGNVRLAFSGLDSSVAGEIEMRFAKAGIGVVSNSKNFRMEPDVPLVYPEINPDHLALLGVQQKNRGLGKGFIVTNSNCSIMAFLPVVHVLNERFGVEAMTVTTMQAISGAGYPGVSSMDILGNIVPHIKDEEAKIETEPLKILGKLDGNLVVPSAIRISASVNRVPVQDGHLASVSVKLADKVGLPAILSAWIGFRALPQELNLPLAPHHPIVVHESPDRPQPRMDVMLEQGMAVSVGRLRDCQVLDYKFTCLVHNTIRGAAGAAVLNAELLKAQNYL